MAHDVVALLANDDVVALLADRTRVLSPRKDHEFFCGIIDDNADGEQSLIAQSRGHRLVRFADNSSAYYAVPEARLVPLEGYADRLLDGCEQRGGEASFYSVWRSEIWVEGLFSLVFWALGFLESEAQRCEPGTRLLIDWSDEEILFHGGRTHTTRGIISLSSRLRLMEALRANPPPLRSIRPSPTIICVSSRALGHRDGSESLAIFAEPTRGAERRI